MNVNREMLAFLRKQYPVGTRIRLDSMQDPYAPVEAGTTGELNYIDDAGQFLSLIHISEPTRPY